MDRESGNYAVRSLFGCEKVGQWHNWPKRVTCCQVVLFCFTPLQICHSQQPNGTEHNTGLEKKNNPDAILPVSKLVIPFTPPLMAHRVDSPWFSDSGKIYGSISPSRGPKAWQSVTVAVFSHALLLQGVTLQVTLRCCLSMAGPPLCWIDHPYPLPTQHSWIQKVTPRLTGQLARTSLFLLFW